MILRGEPGISAVHSCNPGQRIQSKKFNIDLGRMLEPVNTQSPTSAKLHCPLEHNTLHQFGVFCLFSFLSPLWTHTVVFSLYSDTPWPSQIHLHTDASLLASVSPDTHFSQARRGDFSLQTPYRVQLVLVSLQKAKWAAAGTSQLEQQRWAHPGWQTKCSKN